MNTPQPRATASMFMKRYGYRAAPGSRPGSITVPENAIPPTVRITCYDGEHLTEHERPELSRVAELRGQSQVMWIDVVGLGDEEVITALGEQLGLHRLALEDLVTIPQRSKVDHYEDSLFVVAQLPQSSQKQEVEQISFFAGEGYVLSWRERPSSCFDAVRERLNVAGRPLRRSSADYLLYALLDALIDSYFPALETIGEKLDELDDEMARGANTPSLDASTACDTTCVCCDGSCGRYARQSTR